MKLIKVSGLTKYFYSGIWHKKVIKAVNEVSFEIEKGKTLGLVGDSGSGKTTVGRAILRLIEPSSGNIIFNGEDITQLSKKELKQRRRKMQIIFQHPESALNPRLKIIDSIAEPIRLHNLGHKQKELAKILELLDIVRLNKEILTRYPHEISGGEIQRVVLARILSLDPKFIVADEATSMLDVSVQAQILNLMKELQKQLDISYLFISHDLEVVEWMSDEIMVMRNGTVINKEEDSYEKKMVS